MLTASSSMIQSRSTKRLPGDGVQGEEESECDLAAELQIGRKFNSVDEVKELTTGQVQSLWPPHACF